MPELILIILAAYLVGALPCGVILTRLSGAGDIRSSGSGNIGATNVYRVAGRKLGVLTLVCDALKGVLPVLLAAQWGHLPEPQVALVALAVFLGHCYPIYLGFKGGKGVATALGIFIVLSPLTVACLVAIFITLVAIWRYISLGSICAAAAAPLLIFWFERSTALVGATFFIAAIVIWRHRENISRLIGGTENRFRV